MLPPSLHSAYDSYAKSAYLNVHFDDSFPNKCSSKECPERYEKVTTSDASEIKERVGNLEREGSDQNPHKNRNCL